jgi:hypothetical protein
MIHVIVCGVDDNKNSKILFERAARSLMMQNIKFKNLVSLIPTCNFPRKYLLQNMWETIQRSASNIADDDILAFLDADDFLCDEKALEIVENTYKNDSNLLLTYGSYVNYSSSKKGKFNGAYGPEENVRTAPWRASHLKTCKFKLWKQLPETCLKWPDGTWFTCAADRAIMIPLMEMAGWYRCKHIDWLLYCYNDENPNSVWNTMRDESIRTRDYITSLSRMSLYENADI